MNYENFSAYLMTPTQPHGHTFHTSRDCGRLSGARKIVDRGKGYVTYHEAEPCPVCHDTCRECGVVLPAGYLCDDCDTVVVHD